MGGGAVADGVRQRLGPDPVGVRCDVRGQLADGSADVDPRVGDRRERGGALLEQALDGASLQRRAQFRDACVHVGARGAQLREGVRHQLVLRARDLALQGADDEVRGVDALLGGVVQLPGDPLALALDREALGPHPLAAQALQHVCRVREGEHDDERHHEVRRNGLQADRARQRVRVEIGVDRDPEVAQRERGAPAERAPERKSRGRQDQRRQHEHVERAAPVLRGRDERERRRAVDEPRGGSELQPRTHRQGDEGDQHEGDGGGDELGIVGRDAVDDEQQHRDASGEQPRHEQQGHPA
jgi:hypothetical protein